MPRENCVLLVEGAADKLFFEHLCRLLSLEVSVKVNVPTDFEGNYNTKGAVLNTVPLLIDQMLDGRVNRLSVVIDADLLQHGGGQLATLQRFTDIVRSHGFRQRSRVGEAGGYLFSHTDGLEPIGLWIMPDNEHDGIIEEFIKTCVSESQEERFRRSVELLDASVKPFLFNPVHRAKAEVAGWLAWQKIPGQGIFSVIRDGLIDPRCASFSRLSNWLKATFQSNAK